ncbi:aldehyde dehydrogenase family protein [Calothrix sp. PCC 6303]|uniref:aldehyde dehydrogenase family protein n=1 Tax=Calothrix sp. PCC 6303 TaxID=1170562 RepID=UPI0002A04A20|nr:aldehyde dehydrogenase family protein [Calothrix sp. PCC 6303]AFZ04140.1 Aldehyde Dehydrogenase [Calothrix sp. PCC 6303]
MPVTIEVRNPRNGKYDYVIIPPSPKLLSQQCSRLRKARLRWLSIDLDGRIQALQQWRKALLDSKKSLVDALILDTGRLDLSTYEVNSFLAAIDTWCNFAPKMLKDSQHKTAISSINLQQTAVPYELVGIIGYWGFPLLSVIDLIPALLAGCTVIVKPSEITPRFMAPLVKALNLVPKLRDVLTFVEGNEETTINLLEYVDFICFTGDLETGRNIAEIGAQQFIPVCLELGGKDPAIVLESADLELATSAIIWGAVVNSGQNSFAIERIYVAESIYEQFYHQLIAKANRLQLAYPTLESGKIGPLISIPQATKIEAQIENAIAQGAVVHCGGRIEEFGGGLWCLPTVLTEVNHSMEIMREPTLAPVMPVMPFSTIAEAVNLANDSIYGLGAAIFTNSETEAAEIASQIEVGTININDAAIALVMQEGESNPCKFSGIASSRTGTGALTRFLRQKTILSKTKAVKSPWWF